MAAIELKPDAQPSTWTAFALHPLLRRNAYGKRAVPLCRRHIAGGTRHPRVVACAHADFDAFLRTAGITLHGCRVDERGVFASQDIRPGDVLVRVPRSATLHGSSPSQSTAVASAASRKPELHESNSSHNLYGWWYHVACSLVREHALGSQSWWAPYINNLPKDPWSVTWACQVYGVDAVVKQLRPYGMSQQVRRYWAFLHTVYEHARVHDCPNSTTWQTFAWAVSIVFSRAFRTGLDGLIEMDKKQHTPVGRHAGLERHLSQRVSPDQLGVFALIPGLDMLNHSALAETDFVYDPSSDSYVISTGTSFASGEEVFVSYGPKTNEDLLFHYGFIEGASPGDAISIQSSNIQRLVASSPHPSVRFAHAEKSSLLKRLGLVSDDLEYQISRTGIDDEILQVLRICFADENSLPLISAAESRTSPVLCKPLSLENELAAWESVSNECRRRLDRLPRPSAAALEAVDSLRTRRFQSAAWDWTSQVPGTTLPEALFIAEREEILQATKDRVDHFIKVSTAVGRPVTVLLPPSQNVLPTTSFDPLAGLGPTGVHKFVLDELNALPKVTPQENSAERGDD